MRVRQSLRRTTKHEWVRVAEGVDEHPVTVGVSVNSVTDNVDSLLDAQAYAALIHEEV